jgi:membrane-associated phospholipid phosphatase
MVKSFSRVFGIWLLLFVVCATVSAFCFKEVDLPVARFFWRFSHHFGSLNDAFGAKLILTGESVVVLGLVVARLTRGHISRFAEALAIACLASICAYGVNDEVLKPFFGVPPPDAIIHGTRHGFNVAMGFDYSSFPSGHMVLAGAFAGVFMRLYRVSIGPLAGLLLIAACLLVVGDWHYISDVIMGAFVGVSAGMLAGEGWLVHMSSRYG